MKQLRKCCLVAVFTLVISFSLAANGLNLNSIGSRSSAMGTTGIAWADDFSAVFFNPAGLTQMKNANFSLFGTDLIPTGTYRFDMAAVDTETESKMYPSGAASYFNPVSEKLVLGISIYVPSGSGATWKGDELANLTGGTPFEWESMIAVITVAPAVAYKISDAFSVGATLNINYGMLNTKSPGLGQYTEEISGIALGASFGVLFKPSEFISIGASVRTPVKVTFSGDAEMSGAALVGLSTTAEAEREATWPLVAGAGIAVRPVDRLLISADAVFTQWSELETIPVTYDDAGWQFAFAADSEFELRWEDTWQFKIGLEYQITDCLFLRAGYYTDPAPSPLDTQNILLPNIDLTAVTAGIGYRTGRIALDFGFEYIMGDERVVDPLLYPDAMPGIHNYDLIVPNISFTYFFGN